MQTLERDKGNMRLLLARYGALDSCRAVMRAYDLYLYNLYKEKYENNGGTKG